MDEYNNCFFQDWVFPLLEFLSIVSCGRTVHPFLRVGKEAVTVRLGCFFGISLKIMFGSDSTDFDFVMNYGAGNVGILSLTPIGGKNKMVVVDPPVIDGRWILPMIQAGQQCLSIVVKWLACSPKLNVRAILANDKL